MHIFLAESTSWRWNGAQKKRPLSSVVLEPGVKDMLIADARDFLASEVWYAERGIPYRRGYLLHGVPGSGKTSLIHGEIIGARGVHIARDLIFCHCSYCWRALPRHLCRQLECQRVRWGESCLLRQQLIPLFSMSDNALTSLLGRVPARCILLLEGPCD